MGRKNRDDSVPPRSTGREEGDKRNGDGMLVPRRARRGGEKGRMKGGGLPVEVRRAQGDTRGPTKKMTSHGPGSTGEGGVTGVRFVREREKRGGNHAQRRFSDSDRPKSPYVRGRVHKMYRGKGKREGEWGRWRQTSQQTFDPVSRWGIYQERRLCWYSI